MLPDNNIINGFVESLSKQGIKFSSTDGELDNVIFSKDNKTTKMAHEMFYRKSGRCCYLAQDKSNYAQVKPITDVMFYEWIKDMVLYCLEIESC